MDSFLLPAIEKLLFFPLSRTSSDPFVRNFFEKKAYDEHLLDGNALQSSALLTGLFGERRKRRSLAEEDCAMCLFYFAGIPLNNSSFQYTENGFFIKNGHTIKDGPQVGIQSRLLDLVFDF
ncbi:hypothetical protein ACJX0J_000707 (mitochondrion) [Zea mays]